MRNKSANNQSLLDLLLLSLLADGDSYAYQMGQDLKTLSEGSFRIINGSMYPILYKLEDEGYISKYIESGDTKKPRTFYHIEQKGIDYLKTGILQYRASSRAVDKILAKGDKYLEGLE